MLNNKFNAVLLSSELFGELFHISFVCDVIHAERDIRDFDLALSGWDCRHAQQVSSHFPHHMLDQLLQCCDDFVFQQGNARTHIAHNVVMNRIHTESSIWWLGRHLQI